MSKGCEEGMRRFVFRELKKMRLERWARAGSTHLLKNDVDVAGNELCYLLPFSCLY